jgi:hypothetical protein
MRLETGNPKRKVERSSDSEIERGTKQSDDRVREVIVLVDPIKRKLLSEKIFEKDLLNKKP